MYGLYSRAAYDGAHTVGGVPISAYEQKHHSVQGERGGQNLDFVTTLFMDGT